MSKKSLYTIVKLFEVKQMPEGIRSYLKEIYIDFPYVVQPPKYAHYNITRSNKDSFVVAVNAYFIKCGCKYGETVLLHF